MCFLKIKYKFNLSSNKVMDLNMPNFNIQNLIKSKKIGKSYYIYKAVRTNLIARVSRIHGHEILIVSYACLDGDLFF